MENKVLVVLTTAPVGIAEDLTARIVDNRLAACVNIIEDNNSFYFWGSKMQNEYEHLLLIKTLPKKVDKLQAFIKEHHPYETPEFLIIETKSSDDYAKWIEQETQDGI